MAKSKKHTGTIADYKLPPLSEVVFGVQFEPLKDWQIPHIGKFWGLVSDEFSRSQNAPPIGDNLLIEASTGLPVPRVWLINKNDDQLIQLQPGRFLFNWRKRDKAGSYPRYVHLSKKFFELFGLFGKFCSKNKLGLINISQFELTYINHVYEDRDLVFTKDNYKILRHPIWDTEIHSFLPEPSSMSWQSNFPLPDSNGALAVRINDQKLLGDEHKRYLIELSVRGIPNEAPLHNIESWFALAHEWIVRGFEDLTVEKAQKERWIKL